ncbi:MAG TPA: prepilin-type N-terminal cleavage/methylation domain-containing protein [Planctomycetota bacterium]|nr:prepilin-type N-terminal cleavage/methylation domain-containing protein [Planctomycetota bacterium]
MKTSLSRGFTMIELIFSVILMSIFMLTIWASIRSLSVSSSESARGSAELAGAVRMAERFRNDVRQASSVEVSRDGSTLTLIFTDHCVIYAKGSTGRIERSRLRVKTDLIASEVDTGPAVQSVHFALAPATRLLHASWYCWGPADPQSREAQNQAPHTLVLDTSLRSLEEVQRE